MLSLALSSVQAIVAILSSGLPLAITKEYFQGSHGPKGASAIAGLMHIVGLFVACGGAVLFVGGGESSGYISLIAITACAIGLQVSLAASQAILRASERPASFACLALGGSVAPHLGGFLLLTIGEKNSQNYMTGFVLVLLVTILAGLLLTRPRLVRMGSGVYSRGLRLGIPTVPHSGALMLMNQSHMFITGILLGVTAAGEYYFAQIFALAGVTILAALNNAWIPELFGANDSRRAYVVARVRNRALQIAVVLGISGSAFSTLGIFILSTGDSVSSEVIFSAAIVPALGVGYSLYLVSSSIPFMVGRTGQMAWLTPLVLLGTIATSVALALVTGSVVGIAVGQVVGYWVLGLAYYVLSRRILGALPADSGPWLHILVVAAVCSFLALLGAVPTAGIWVQSVVGIAVLLIAASIWRVRRGISG